ncbi:hypothetical protein [Malonomonas rubra]|uniref:hypothetical protein n=1 Tax=Malonomonas rubra TaxID=57040 RepID=UPI0026ED70ED|nr:hypothetical protein [Malonomonas rubra]
MLKFLSRKSVLLTSLLFMTLMMVICMRLVNPAIDGQGGASLLALQLAFDKNLGIEIINCWGAEGSAVYRRWCFTDYLYAISYTIFLASLLVVLLFRKGKIGSSILSSTPFIVLGAGVCDCLENMMEYFFIQDPHNFPAQLFFAHSLISVLKWAGIFTAVATVIFLLPQRPRQTE